MLSGLFTGSRMYAPGSFSRIFVTLASRPSATSAALLLTLLVPTWRTTILGLTLSRAPFSMRHSTCSVRSSRMLKLRQCSGAKYWFQVSVSCSVSNMQSPRNITSGSFSRQSDINRRCMLCQRLSPSTSGTAVGTAQGFMLFLLFVCFYIQHAVYAVATF